VSLLYILHSAVCFDINHGTARIKGFLGKLRILKKCMEFPEGWEFFEKLGIH